MSLTGVYHTHTKNGTSSYRASMTYHRKHISLGSFRKEATAHQVYLEAQHLLSTPDLSISDYRRKMQLPFDKFISLLNLRDHQIYFSNPIYLQKSYFSYYMAPHLELKFDLDDLFYYSSHRIMLRDRHLFIDDYGSQISLPSRYGIRSYAIAGKDYEFVNQDPYDFRYINIKIYNPYFGVRKVTKKYKELYQARIHVRSYYVIGFYPTAVKAAIAYNKAVDLLRRQGINRNFPLNYIEEITASQYAELYDAISVSDRIEHFHLTT